MIEEPHTKGDGEVGGESPSGLWSALEAILLVADEPVAENILAQVLEVAQADVAAALHGLAAAYATRAGDSTCARSPAAGATTPGPSSRP